MQATRRGSNAKFGQVLLHVVIGKTRVDLFVQLEQRPSWPRSPTIERLTPGLQGAFALPLPINLGLVLAWLRAFVRLILSAFYPAKAQAAHCLTDGAQNNWQPRPAA